MITTLTVQKRYKVSIEEIEKFKTKIIIFDNDKGKEVLFANTERSVEQALTYVGKMYSKRDVEIKLINVNKEIVKTVNKEQLSLFTDNKSKSEFETFIKQVTGYVDRFKVNFKLKFKRNEEGNLICEFWTKEEVSETFSYLEKDGNSYKYYHCDKLQIRNKSLEKIFE